MTGPRPMSELHASRIVRVVNTAGLHARPCHAIVQTALEFTACDVRIKRPGAGDDGVNGKSILELMTLEASQGSELEILGTGDGIEGLLDALDALFASGFGE